MKGYINIYEYKVIVHDSTNPGRYGFIMRTDHISLPPMSAHEGYPLPRLYAYVLKLRAVCK